jgi:hypothetical protein
MRSEAALWQFSAGGKDVVVIVYVVNITFENNIALSREAREKSTIVLNLFGAMRLGLYISLLGLT